MHRIFHFTISGQPALIFSPGHLFVTFELTMSTYRSPNPLNAELNPISHLLALLGTHHILHVSRIRVKNATACHLVLKHFAFYEIRGSIVTFTTAPTGSFPEPAESSPQPHIPFTSDTFSHVHHLPFCIWCLLFGFSDQNLVCSLLLSYESFIWTN
jgi:hypothetical protein